MKRSILFMGLMLWGIMLLAQLPTIKNASFENWTDKGGFLYPDDWNIGSDTTVIKSGILSRKTGGTSGTYALHLGCYLKDGVINGTLAISSDTLTDRIGGLAFDYKVQNNYSSMLNGLLVRIAFYDSADGYLGDYKWSSPSLVNNSTFKMANFTALFCDKRARYYYLEFDYFNYGGSIDEYAEIDNLRFLKNTSIDDKSIELASKGKVMPNPASSKFNLTGLNPTDFGSVFLIDVYGKQISMKNATEYDVTMVPDGLYFVKVFNKSGELVHYSKLLVKK